MSSSGSGFGVDFRTVLSASDTTAPYHSERSAAMHRSGPLKLIGRCHPAPPADDRSYRTRPCPSTGHGGRPSPDWRTRRRPTGPRRTDGRTVIRTRGQTFAFPGHLPLPLELLFPETTILFIIKFVQLGTQIKTQCKKRKYTKIHKKYIMKYIKTIS